jgi:hypothetical protein
VAVHQVHRAEDQGAARLAVALQGYSPALVGLYGVEQEVDGAGGRDVALKVAGDASDALILHLLAL